MGRAVTVFFFTCGVTGILILFFSQSVKPPGLSLAVGAEQKDSVVNSDHFLIEKCATQNNDVYEYWAERIITPGQHQPAYFACLQLKNSDLVMRVSEAQAKDFLKLHDSVKNAKKAPSEIITRARVIWSANGRQYQFVLEGSSVWRFIDDQGKLGNVLDVQIFTNVIKDIESMKAVNPSLKW